MTVERELENVGVATVHLKQTYPLWYCSPVYAYRQAQRGPTLIINARRTPFTKSTKEPFMLPRALCCVPNLMKATIRQHPREFEWGLGFGGLVNPKP